MRTQTRGHAAAGSPLSEDKMDPNASKSLKKFTLYIRPEVMKEVKIKAINEDKSFSFVVEEAIAAYLKK